MDKKEIIKLLREEIDLLQEWVDYSLTGGWSTHLVDPMRKRRAELLNTLYKLEKV